MIKRTSNLLATKTSLVIFMTSLSLIEPRMVLYFLPTMHLLTLEPTSTTIIIIHQKLISFPIRTLLQLLLLKTRLPSEILPIVTILTLRTIMFKLIERTEHCFEMEHIEILILLQSVDQRHTEFSHRMSERTINAIFTIINLIWIFLTKLTFVFAISIQHFHIIMTELTILPFQTLFTLLNIQTHFTTVMVSLSLFVFLIMIIGTVLVVVFITHFALECFEFL